MTDVDVALGAAKDLLRRRNDERPALERVAHYLAGRHDSVYVPKSARREFAHIVDRSRVNVLPLVVDTIAQSLFVDGYRDAGDDTNKSAWRVWQANRMDARQTGLHRAALTFGAAYVLVLPGDPLPAWQPLSPLRVTAVYADLASDEWPEMALVTTGKSVRLITTDSVWDLTGDESKLDVVGVAQHGLDVCPLVRFANRADVDGFTVGEVAPLIPLQDQINMITFGLLMAQQYGAFRQRWVTGMAVPEDDAGRPLEPFNAAVSRLWTAEGADTKFGEFGQTDLGGYLSAREATLRALATVAQVPPNHLIGQMANMSAEALAAAEVQQTRKVQERKTLFGESWEACFRLSGAAIGDQAIASDVTSQVVWRDTEARSMSQTADALGKLAQMLQVPVEMLWEQIPGWTQTDVERARSMATRRLDADALAQAKAFGLTGSAAPDAAG